MANQDSAILRRTCVCVAFSVISGCLTTRTEPPVCSLEGGFRIQNNAEHAQNVETKIVEEASAEPVFDEVRTIDSGDVHEYGRYVDDTKSYSIEIRTASLEAEFQMDQNDVCAAIESADEILVRYE